MNKANAASPKAQFEESFSIKSMLLVCFSSSKIAKKKTLILSQELLKMW